MFGRGKTILAAVILLCLAGSISAQEQISADIPILGITSRSLSILCQDSTENKELNLKNYFSQPEEQDGIVSVFYNNLIDPEDKEQFGYALLYGLDYAFDNAVQAQTIAVGIYYLNGTGIIFFLPKKAYEEFEAKKIGTAQMYEQLRKKEVNWQ